MEIRAETRAHLLQTRTLAMTSNRIRKLAISSRVIRELATPSKIISKVSFPNSLTSSLYINRKLQAAGMTCHNMIPWWSVGVWKMSS